MVGKVHHDAFSEADIWILRPDIWRLAGQWLAKSPLRFGPTVAGHSWAHAAGRGPADYVAGEIGLLTNNSNNRFVLLFNSL